MLRLGGPFMKYVYILQSEKFDKFYVGITDDIENRLNCHNSEFVPSTKPFIPWKIKNYFYFDDANKALQFEKYLKSGSGRAFTKKHF